MSAEKGSTLRESSLRKARRDRCGARSPIHPIGPVTATTAATSPAPSRSTSIRIRPTLIPNDCAAWSPSRSVFNGRASSRPKGRQTATQGATIQTCSHVLFARLPSRKKNRDDD